MIIQKEKPARGNGGHSNIRHSETNRATAKSQWECQKEFLNTMHQAGVMCLDEIIADGKIHRFKPGGKGNKDGWYVFFGSAGSYGDWRKDIKRTWSTKNQFLTPQEKAEHQKQIRRAKEALEQETQRKHQETAESALREWNSFSETGQSEYLTRKQVDPMGVRFGEGFMAVPLKDTQGKLWSFQRISPDGTKRFLAGGRKKGCFHHLGTLKNGDVIYVSEGYATGASIYMAIHQPTVIASDATNLEPVITELRKAYPSSPIVIAGDNDLAKERNTGKEKAEETAREQECRVVLPIFKDYSTDPTDFNDLHVSEGLDEVKRQINNGIARYQHCSVAVSSETLTEQDFEAAMSPAMLAIYDVAALQSESEFYIKDDKPLHTKAIFVRNMNNETREVLRSFYPYHAVLKLPDDPVTLETIPSFVKEAIIVSSKVSDKEQKKDRFRKRLLQRRGVAVSIVYLPDDMEVEAFIKISNKSNLKSFINQAHSNLEIPSCLTEMTEASSLFKYKTREPEFLVTGLIPSIGIAILAGHPKSGKSWMILNFIKAILNGDVVFGEFPTKKLGVYYMSLEDNAARLKTRLQMIYGEDLPCIENLKLKTYSKQLNDEVLKELKSEIENNPNIKCIVIDPYQKVRTSPDKNLDAYQKDYKDISALKNLAEEYEISIILVHHLKKDKNSKSSDDYDVSSLNGSMGLAGSADSILLLKKEDQNVSLKITGKDVEDRTLALTFDPESGLFSIDEEERIAVQGLQGDILRCLKTQNRPCRPKEISNCLGRTTAAEKSSLRTQLVTLRNKNLVSYQNGLYSLKTATCATSYITNIAGDIATSNQHEIRGNGRNCNAAMLEDVNGVACIKIPDVPPSEMKEVIL
jgi:putative DNA primase/helicase